MLRLRVTGTWLLLNRSWEIHTVSAMGLTVQLYRAYLEVEVHADVVETQSVQKYRVAG